MCHTICDRFMVINKCIIFTFFFFFLRKYCYKTCTLKRVLGVSAWLSKGNPSSMEGQLGYEDFLMHDVRNFPSHLHQPFRSLKLLQQRAEG